MKKIYNRTCIICGKHFTTHRKKKKTCSKKCYKANYQITNARDINRYAARYRKKNRLALRAQSRLNSAHAYAKRKAAKCAVALLTEPKWDIDKWNEKAYGVRLLLGEIEI